MDTVEDNDEEDTSRSEGEPDLQKLEAKDDAVIPQPPGPLRRSARERRVPERYRQEGSERAYLASATTPSIKDALAGPDSAAWMAAMEQEKAQLKKYGVYEELDTLPPGKKTVDTKWVLREKYDQARRLGKRKARPTARGFTQIHRLHYNDTYAPAARCLYGTTSKGHRLRPLIQLPTP